MRKAPVPGPAPVPVPAPEPRPPPRLPDGPPEEALTAEAGMPRAGNSGKATEEAPSTTSFWERADGTGVAFWRATLTWWRVSAAGPPVPSPEPPPVKATLRCSETTETT